MMFQYLSASSMRSMMLMVNNDFGVFLNNYNLWKLVTLYQLCKSTPNHGMCSLIALLKCSN